MLCAAPHLHLHPCKTCNTLPALDMRCINRKSCGSSPREPIVCHALIVVAYNAASRVKRRFGSHAAHPPCRHLLSCATPYHASTVYVPTVLSSQYGTQPCATAVLPAQSSQGLQLITATHTHHHLAPQPPSAPRPHSPPILIRPCQSHNQGLQQVTGGRGLDEPPRHPHHIIPRSPIRLQNARTVASHAHEAHARLVR